MTISASSRKQKRWLEISGGSASLFNGGPPRYHFVDNAEGFRLLRRHEVVAIERPLNDLVGLTGVLSVNFVQAALRFKNVLGVPLDIACLALETGGGLMHHDPCVGQGPAHAVFSRREQERTHGGRLTGQIASCRTSQGPTSPDRPAN